MNIRISRDLERALGLGFCQDQDFLFAVLKQLDRNAQPSAVRALTGLLYLDPFNSPQQELDRCSAFIEDAKAELERWLGSAPESLFVYGQAANFQTNAQKRKVQELIERFHTEMNFHLAGPYEDDHAIQRAYAGQGGLFMWRKDGPPLNPGDRTEMRHVFAGNYITPVVVVRKATWDEYMKQERKYFPNDVYYLPQWRGLDSTESS